MNMSLFHYAVVLILFTGSVSAAFLQANTNAGCCISNDIFHRRCFCDNIEDPTVCRSLCLCDKECKGYVMLQYNPNYCQLATNSSCPNDCRGPANTGSVEELDPNAECGTIGKWSGGCFIKSLDANANQLCAATTTTTLTQPISTTVSSESSTISTTSNEPITATRTTTTTRYTTNIVKGNTKNGDVETTYADTSDVNGKTEPVMTLDAARNTLGMYFHIFREFKLEDKILVLGQIML